METKSNTSIFQVRTELQSILGKLEEHQLTEANHIAARVLYHCSKELLNIIYGLDLYATIKKEIRDETI